LLGGEGTLPVIYLNLLAKPLGNDRIEVLWSTSEEIDNDYFIVERSRDGSNFFEIGRITGKGTTNDQHKYRLIDYDPLLGWNFYRLKQVDFDGAFEFSRIVSVPFNPGTEISVFPNPANDHFNVRIAFGEVSFELFNVLGQRETVQPSFKEGIYTFNTTELNSGMYVLKVQNGMAEHNMKVIVE
jgi:hypothetical protein